MNKHNNVLKVTVEKRKEEETWADGYEERPLARHRCG
jgi:hypothetical protein